MAIDSKIGLLVPNIRTYRTCRCLGKLQECERILTAARERQVANADLSNGRLVFQTSACARRG